MVMVIVKQLARLPEEQVERALRQVATTRSWQRWLSAASSPRARSSVSPPRSGATTKSSSTSFAKRKVARGPYCHAHNMVRDRCPLCDGTWKIAYISGGGTRYHRVPDCPSLVRGQKLVDERGGTREPVSAVRRRSIRLMERAPCATCIPVEFRRAQQKTSMVPTRRRKSPDAALTPHGHRWGPWRTQGDGTVRRMCYECEATELRIGGETRRPTARPALSGMPPAAVPAMRRRKQQQQSASGVGFLVAARHLAGLDVERPPGLPRKNWTAVGTMNLGCTECGTSMGVLEHPGSRSLVLLCRWCRRAWPVTDYDDGTCQQVRKFVNQENAATPASRSVDRARNLGGDVDQAAGDEERPPIGPGRIPTGDGPRSHPRHGWTDRW